MGPVAGSLDHLVREPDGEPVGALVLLHGRGADEHDLFPLLDLLDPERRLLGVTPGGPLALPPGGRHWYQLGGIPTPDPATFLESAHVLGAFLDRLPVPAERTVIGGFSQGSVMAWALSLGSGRPRPAGVIGLSGFLPRVDAWPLDASRLAGVPVAVGHGSMDAVIPASFGEEARDVLTAAGADVTWIETPFPHGVDAAWIAPLRDTIARALG